MLFRKPAKAVTISKFEKAEIKISGMRSSYKYEIVYGENECDIILYIYKCTADGYEPVPDKRASCRTEDVLEIFNSCCLAAWDGFHGKHPKNVHDGTMFELKAVINDGMTIYADGSENFPRHYHELISWLSEAVSN
jgi:hypothetical protein